MEKTKIVRSKRKTISLQVLPDSTILVKAPTSISLKEINKFIESSWEWIEKKRLLYQRTKLQKKSFVNGEKYTFLGKEYQLKIGSFRQILIDGDYLLFPQIFRFRAEKEIENWYIKQAQKIITEQVKYYSQQMEVEYTCINYSDTKSKWGSCTHDKKLQFNWRLIMAPMLVLNYVVIHELAHIKELNHSRAFWSKVRLYNPSYKQQIKWLKSFGHTLQI